jgi:hypothetical protein
VIQDCAIPLTPGFQSRGITPAAYFLLPFAIAVAAGIVLRNTASAIGLTVAIYVAFLLLFGFARLHYAVPEQFRQTIPAAASAQPATSAGDWWQLDHYYGDAYYADAAGAEVKPRTDDCPTEAGYEQCLAQQGVVGLLIDYQPADRLWQFQATEAALAVAASAAVLAAGVLCSACAGTSPDRGRRRPLADQPRAISSTQTVIDSRNAWSSPGAISTP